jgi:hypothetical protein
MLRYEYEKVLRSVLSLFFSYELSTLDLYRYSSLLMT